MPSYWFDVFTPRTWDEARAQGFSVTGFSETKRSTVERVQPGDFFLCYLKGRKQFVGVLRAIGKPNFACEPRIWVDHEFPMRVPVEAVVALDEHNFVDADELIRKLSVFDPNSLKRTWARFQGSPTKLTDADGEILLSALKAAATRRPIRTAVHAGEINKRSSFLNAARIVLEEAGVPLRSDEIARRALQQGHLSTAGKTPAATMAARLYTEIRDHGEQSTFELSAPGTFGLRGWAAKRESPTIPSRQEVAPKVVMIAQDEADRLAGELLEAQNDSANPTQFERVLAAAFEYLGFRARHVGGSGQTDILLASQASAASYRVVVDAKSSRNGRVADAQIDWNSLGDHRKAEGADYALVVAPDFSGGNLLKRADDYGVVLLKAEALADLLRLHRSAPFTLLELRMLFETPGPATSAVEQLRQTAQQSLMRWRLLGNVLTLVEQLPVDADTRNLWLLLAMQQRENPPTQEAVEDAVAVLASRAVGALRLRNGSGEYQSTMQRSTALRRLRALAAAAGGVEAAFGASQVRKA